MTLKLANVAVARVVGAACEETAIPTRTVFEEKLIVSVSRIWYDEPPSVEKAAVTVSPLRLICRYSGRLPDTPGTGFPPKVQLVNRASTNTDPSSRAASQRFGAVGESESRIFRPARERSESAQCRW